MAEKMFIVQTVLPLVAHLRKTAFVSSAAILSTWHWIDIIIQTHPNVASRKRRNNSFKLASKLRTHQITKEISLIAFLWWASRRLKLTHKSYSLKALMYDHWFLVVILVLVHVILIPMSHAWIASHRNSFSEAHSGIAWDLFSRIYRHISTGGLKIEL